MVELVEPEEQTLHLQIKMVVMEVLEKQIQLQEVQFFMLVEVLERLIVVVLQVQQVQVVVEKLIIIVHPQAVLVLI